MAIINWNVTALLGGGSAVVGFCNEKIPPSFHRNIVSTVNLACKLDLKNIVLHARNAEYNPKVNLGLKAVPSLPFPSADRSQCSCDCALNSPAPRCVGDNFRMGKKHLKSKYVL